MQCMNPRVTLVNISFLFYGAIGFRMQLLIFFSLSKSDLHILWQRMKVPHHHDGELGLQSSLSQFQNQIQILFMCSFFLVSKVYQDLNQQAIQFMIYDLDYSGQAQCSIYSSILVKNSSDLFLYKYALPE